MKDILDRLGLYDFFGIWGPGAITITYYLFTLCTPMEKLCQLLGIANPGLETGYIIVILYTTVAYTAGVVLHELGKIISDRIFKLSPQRIRSTADYTPMDAQAPINMRREYKLAIEANIPREHYECTGFDKANSELKYNPVASRKTESTHAIYALSRSLFLCFALHVVFTSLASLLGQIGWKALIFILLIDVGLAVLFAIRTHRYYYAWIKNVFIQHYIVSNTPQQPITH